MSHANRFDQVSAALDGLYNLSVRRTWNQSLPKGSRTRANHRFR
jgi:hypothetical protein